MKQNRTCSRCFAVFDNIEQFDEHMLYLHGEVSKQKHIEYDKETDVHKIYKWYFIDGKSYERNVITPPEDEWRIEIIIDNKNNCFCVKDLEKLRKNGSKVKTDDLDFSSDFIGV